MKLPLNHHFPMEFLWNSYGFPRGSWGLPGAVRRLRKPMVVRQDFRGPGDLAALLASPGDPRAFRRVFSWGNFTCVYIYCIYV